MNGTVRQLIRFGVVGLASNAIGYGLYLLLTRIGVGPRYAMSVLYSIGVLQAFVFNKRWTFNHQGSSVNALGNYVLLYALGYAFNVVTMTVCIEVLAWPHQWVMLGLLLIMPLLFFGGQKFWVFRSPSRS